LEWGYLTTAIVFAEVHLGLDKMREGKGQERADSAGWLV